MKIQNRSISERKERKNFVKEVTLKLDLKEWVELYYVGIKK